MEWQPIETLPERQEALVCVTHNLPDDEGWETVMWTDWFITGHGWFRYPRLIEIPFPPTHWMPLPDPPPHRISTAEPD
jgi:hypothetical protein